MHLRMGAQPFPAVQSQCTKPWGTQSMVKNSFLLRESIVIGSRCPGQESGDLRLGLASCKKKRQSKKRYPSMGPEDATHAALSGFARMVELVQQ